jgi:hypothetical protein
MTVVSDPDRANIQSKQDAATAPEMPVVLFVGDDAWPEFAAVHRWLQVHSHLSTAADLSSAHAQIIAAASDPELIVLAQTWPGEFSGGDVDRLRFLAPQTRLSELLGSYCEGPARTAQPTAGAIRHYWHQWVARLGPEFARRAAGLCPTWSLPLTATDEERLLALPQGAAGRDRGLIAVFSRHGQLARALCDACPHRGFAGLWIRQRARPYLAGIRAVVWDVPYSPATWSGELAELKSLNAPIVALVSFPREEDIDRLHDAGAAVVVSKPFWLDDLFGQIHRL